MSCVTQRLTEHFGGDHLVNSFKKKEVETFGIRAPIATIYLPTCIQMSKCPNVLLRQKELSRREQTLVREWQSQYIKFSFETLVCHMCKEKKA